MKKFFGIIGLIVTFVVFSACGNNEDATSPTVGGIVSIMPSPTEILVALGFGDSIIATDETSANIAGIDPTIATLSAWGLDLEYIITLNPDLVIASEMIAFAGDPLEPLASLGINVVYIADSSSIDDIRSDIRQIAEIVGAFDAGEALVAQMDAEIDAVHQIVQGITQRPTVYFEIWPLFTVGGGTFLNELIEIAGGENITGHLDSWPNISDEFVLTANPDVILTSTDPNYSESPVDEILHRTGWGGVAAVVSGRVYQIDTDTSNRPTHNVVQALWQIARAIHPEYFVD
ncbi:MAG: helical backbone metal receptor [Defluviitaleaceae bacterium]|nr:helical backbone metal receptor [Defluviitaleaceae bacterium]